LIHFKIVLFYNDEVNFIPDNAIEIGLVHIDCAPLLSDEQKAFLADQGADVYCAQSVMDAIVYVGRPSTSDHAVVLWISGHAALDMENLSDTVLGRICHDVLCHFLDGASSLNQPVQTIR
jgi:hypothetical protein